MTRRKLIKVAEFKHSLADGFQVEGTKLYVLELVMYGFAHVSRFLLVRSKGVLEKLRDEREQLALNTRPYEYGRTLKLGKELEYDDATRCVYYVGEVREKDLLQDEGGRRNDE